MASSNRRVHQISKLAGCTTELALRVIRGMGIAVASENDLVPKGDADRALNGVLAETARLAEIERLEAVRRKSAQRPTPIPAPEARPSRPVIRNREIVGHIQDELSYLTADEVEQIHWHLVRDFAKSRDPIEPPGLRSKNLLESALHRVHTSLGGEAKYPTVPMAAAAYLHSIIGNHAFHNGNKRTALVATLVFLDINGFVLVVEQDALYDYLLDIAKHGIVDKREAEALADDEMIEIARWIHRSARPVSNQERVLKFRELRAILDRYGCELEHATRGNRMNIRRGDYQTQIHYRNEGSDVMRDTMRKVRTDLRLTDADGYDSTIFYNMEERIPTFIHTYRRTLDRLAKV
jgi:death-on-curing family protein